MKPANDWRRTQRTAQCGRIEGEALSPRDCNRVVCNGGNVGGYTLFVKDKKLHYVQNYVGVEEFHDVSNVDVPEGKVELRYEFEAEERQGFARQGATLHQQEARGRDVAALHRAPRARDRQRHLCRAQFRLSCDLPLWSAF
jgi:hypothetical protein